MTADRPSDTPEPSRPRERFAPAVKACRDLLVDDVDRYLGVPIIGQPVPVSTIGPGDVGAALHSLVAAIIALDRDRTPHGPHVQACRDLLDDVARLLGAPAGVVLTTQVTSRQIRLARRRLADAIDHLTTVMFDQPAHPTTRLRTT